MTMKDELARDIFLADNTNAAPGLMEQDWDENPTTYHYAHAIAEGLIAKGYRKTEPRWADTLTKDGTYEYTISSDCDGSNVQHWRRVRGKTYIEDASPWEAYEPEVAA